MHKNLTISELVRQSAEAREARSVINADLEDGLQALTVVEEPDNGEDMLQADSDVVDLVQETDLALQSFQNVLKDMEQVGGIARYHRRQLLNIDGELSLQSASSFSDAPSSLCLQSAKKSVVMSIISKVTYAAGRAVQYMLLTTLFAMGLTKEKREQYMRLKPLDAILAFPSAVGHAVIGMKNRVMGLVKGKAINDKRIEVTQQAQVKKAMVDSSKEENQLLVELDAMVQRMSDRNKNRSDEIKVENNKLHEERLKEAGSNSHEFKDDLEKVAGILMTPEVVADVTQTAEKITQVTGKPITPKEVVKKAVVRKVAKGKSIKGVSLTNEQIQGVLHDWSYGKSDLFSGKMEEKVIEIIIKNVFDKLGKFELIYSDVIRKQAFETVKRFKSEAPAFKSSMQNIISTYESRLEAYLNFVTEGTGDIRNWGENKIDFKRDETSFNFASDLFFAETHMQFKNDLDEKEMLDYLDEFFYDSLRYSKKLKVTTLPNGVKINSISSFWDEAAAVAQQSKLDLFTAVEPELKALGDLNKRADEIIVMLTKMAKAAPEKTEGYIADAARIERMIKNVTSMMAGSGKLALERVNRAAYVADLFIKLGVLSKQVTTLFWLDPLVKRMLN